MFPVVVPPIVRVFPRRDWIVDVAALKDNPLLLVEAESVATGVPLAIPVTANLAEEVVTPPSRKSVVRFPGAIIPVD